MEANQQGDLSIEQLVSKLEKAVIAEDGLIGRCDHAMHSDTLEFADEQFQGFT
jgi:hypothetical protein